jgi:hypothetical protein
MNEPLHGAIEPARRASLQERAAAVLIKRRTFLTGLSSLALAPPATASHGVTPSAGSLFFCGPQQPWSGVSVDFVTHGRLRVNISGRYLEHTDGTYFPWLADTGWELMSNLTLSEATTYLEARRASGFTMVQCAPIGLAYPTNRNGDAPFVNFDTPNTTYFNFVDSVVSVAAAKGIGLLFFPIWGNNYGVSTRNTINQFTQTQAANFGTYIANRYASSPLVIYGVGGDYGVPINATVTAQYVAMGAAIKAANSAAVITGHCGTNGSTGETTASDFQSNSWFSFSGGQSGHWSQNNAYAYSIITTGWNASPTKPTINLESSYENAAINFNSANGYFTPFDVRQQMWWALCAGAFGATYGNYSVSNFQRHGQAFPGTPGPLYPDWYNTLGGPLQPAADQARNIRSLLQARPGLRTPDQTLVVSALSGGQTIMCCRGSNFAWIYTPYGDTFTVNMGKISGASVKAYWFSPRDGSVIYINTYTNSGTRAFTPPGISAAGNDYVLVLDDAAVAFPIPGM